MLQFNELKITNDSKSLVISVKVKDDDYYENVYIDSIIIDTQDTYVSNGFSENPIYSLTLDEDCKYYSISLDTIDLQNTPLDKTMFFVYVTARGIPSEDTPCGMDNAYIMGTVINLYPFYQSCISTLQELNNTCAEPKEFIDKILRLKAIELNIKTGNYPLAIRYFNKFFKNLKSFKPSNCGCHGRAT